jgi:5-methylcytosine-specific restriction endonuclease McrA
MRSWRWQMVKIRKLNAAAHKCENCGEPYGLQVHHLTYERLGRELDTDLVVLCRQCHANEHRDR